LWQSSHKLLNAVHNLGHHQRHLISTCTCLLLLLLVLLVLLPLLLRFRLLFGVLSAATNSSSSSSLQRWYLQQVTHITH
jgi:hypothetical protein